MDVCGCVCAETFGGKGRRCSLSPAADQRNGRKSGVRCFTRILHPAPSLCHKRGVTLHLCLPAKGRAGSAATGEVERAQDSSRATPRGAGGSGCPRAPAARRPPRFGWRGELRAPLPKDEQAGGEGLLCG